MRAARASLRTAASGPCAAGGMRRRPFAVAPVFVLASCAGGCNGGPCATAVAPPGMSTSVDVSPVIACAIAEQKELAGGLTWTAAAAPSGPPAAPSMVSADGGPTPSFAIVQDGFSAISECTAACTYNYNECFLPNGYLEAYVGAESASGNAAAEAGVVRGAVGVAADGGSACPAVASVTVTCTYTSAGFCQ